MSGASDWQPNRERVEGWVRDHGRAVRGYAQAVLGRDDVADDLVQEVFRRAWQARDRYQENGSARGYLLRIADRLVCDHRRRTRHEMTLDPIGWQEVEPIESGNGPASGLEAIEIRQTIEAALGGLSMSQRRVLLLRFYGDLSFAEIAEVLDSPLGTVLSHCRRGLLMLRKILTEDAS